MKRLVDYVKAIKGVASPHQIVSRDSQSETKKDVTGSTIEITKEIYYFNDGVSVEYEREYDDGAPYPGCKEFWYTYRVVDTHGFEFEGEKSHLFQSSSEISKWIA